MRLEVSQPILGFDDMARLRGISLHTGGKFKSYELNICYPLAWGRMAWKPAWPRCAPRAVDAVKSGHNILIVSDRSVGPDRVAIPALLATSTVHRHLVSKGLRASTGLVVETGSARETHHFALLAGYGAEAIHPYLAMETLVEMAHGMPGDMSGDKACTTTSRRSARA